MQKSTSSLLFLFLFLPFFHNAQEQYQVDIEEKRENNRVYIYALNKTLTDLDVSIEVSGTGFRQREGRQRVFRVPARSKITIKTLVAERGQVPLYKYKLNISDSLSRRVVKPPYELIKINPKKKITLFLTDSCTAKCDSLIRPLDNSPFFYDAIKISENDAVKTQISNALIGGQKRLDTMTSPIVMLGGKMYLQIEDYDALMEKMNSED